MNPSDFLLEVIAVFVGVIAAFELDNYRERRQETKESVRVLELIEAELNENIKLLKQFHELFAKPETVVPYYHLRLIVWEGVRGKIDLIKNDKLLTDVMQVYFAIDMLERTLTVYKEHHSTWIGETSTMVKAAIQQRVEAHRRAMVTQIEQLQPRVVSAQTEIRQEINRLS